MSASSDYLNVLTSITREGGATRAATQRANSQIWGNAVAKLGDFASDAIKQYGIDKKAKKDEKWQQDISDLFKRSSEEFKAQQEPSMAEMTQAPAPMQAPYQQGDLSSLPLRPASAPTMPNFQAPDPRLQPQPGNDLPQQGGITGTQPNTTGDTFTGPELKNARPTRQSPFPTPSEILALGQPLNGIKVIDGLAALQKLNPQDSEEAKVKRMQAVYRGMDTLSEADRAAAFPGLMGAFEQVYGMPLGDKTYTPEKWKAIGAGLQVGPKESTAQPTEWSLRADLSSKDPDVRARARTALDSAAKTPTTNAFNSWNEVEIAASNPTDPRHDNAVAMLQNRPAGADSMSGPEADEKYRQITMKPPKARTPEDAAWADAYKQQKTMVPAATFQMNAPVRETGREDKTYDRQTARIDKVVGPIRDQLTRINKLSSTLNQMTPTADALIAPELLTAMAGGMGSGLRMNEAEISRIVGGRSNWETLKSKLNQWSLDPSKALSITDEQRKEMRSLVKEVQRQAQDKVRSLSKSSSDLDNASSVDEMRKIANKALQGLEDETTTPNSTTGGLPAVGDTFQGGTVRKVTRLP